MCASQTEIDVDAGPLVDGYAVWQAELAKSRAAVERRWGVILGNRVSVKLVDRDIPLEGKLIVMEHNPKSRDPRKLWFHLAGCEFVAAEIESIVRIGDSLS